MSFSTKWMFKSEVINCRIIYLEMWSCRSEITYDSGTARQIVWFINNLACKMPWSVWVKLWWSSSTRGFWDFALKECLKEGLEASSISCVVKMSYDSNEISGNVLHSSRSICFPKWFEYSNKIVVCLLSCHYIRICSKQTRNLVLLGNYQKKGNFWHQFKISIRFFWKHMAIKIPFGWAFFVFELPA